MNPNDELLNAFGQASNAAGFKAGKEEGMLLGVIGFGTVFCLFLAGSWLYHDHQARISRNKLQALQSQTQAPQYSTRATLT